MSRPEESWTMQQHREHAAEALAEMLKKRNAAHGEPRTPDQPKPKKNQNRPHWVRREKKA